MLSLPVLAFVRVRHCRPAASCYSPGSGALSTYLSSLFVPGRTPIVLAVDINIAACRGTAATAAQNKQPRVEAVCDDLAASLRLKVRPASCLGFQWRESAAYVCCSGHDSCLLPQGLVDVLLFNPPYVPTPSAEVGGSGIEASWAGGDRGREVIDRLIPAIKVVSVLAQCGFSRAAHTTLCVQDMLSPNGVFYMLVVQDNDPDEIAQLFAKDGLACEVSCLAAWTRLV